jgi:hypothetical protein
MAKKRKPAKAVIPHVRHAVEDEYVQEQLRNAVSRLSDAYARISRKKVDAANEKKLYRSLRGAAVSIRKAVGAIEEPPPKRRGRNALLVGFAVAGTGLIAKRARKGGSAAARQPAGLNLNGNEQSAGGSSVQATPAQPVA